MKPSRRIIAPALLLGLAAVALPAFADMLPGQEHESRYISDKFYFELGWFGADLSTDIAFGFGQNLGSFLRLEDDLNLEETVDTGRFMAQWRFNRKHALSFNVTQLNRDATNVIGGDFEIGDPDTPGEGIRFSADAEINSVFDNNVFAFIYKFSFYNNGKINAGITAGLSFYDFSIELSGEAVVIDEDGNEIGGTGFQRFTEDFLAPVPTFGVHVSYAFNPKTIFRFTTAALDLDIGDFEGRITQTNATVQYFFIRNLSVGGGITSNNIDVRDTGSDPWRVAYRYGGFSLFLGAAF